MFTEKEFLQACNTSLKEYYASIEESYNLFIRVKNELKVSTETSVDHFFSEEKEYFYNFFTESITLQETATGFLEYIKKYDVNAKTIDNYKVRYFMGKYLIEHIEKNTALKSNIDIEKRQISYLMLLVVMKNTHKRDFICSIPDDMYLKFAMTLLTKNGEYSKNPLEHYFGKYGMYLIFKTVSKTINRDNSCLQRVLCS